jgi:hypothetical protein
MPETAQIINRVKVDVPFEGDEDDRFRRFVKDTGRAQGPWVRTIILKAMAEEQKRESRP